jgi:predicted enzyme related to lactoylglutathione lyase
MRDKVDNQGGNQMTGSGNQARFVWYELHPIDAKGVTDFYTKVFPWTVTGPDGDYLMINVGDIDIGGMMAHHPGGLHADNKAAWTSYIGVASIENSLVQLQTLGGTVHQQPEMIPNVGRFAAVSDPDGVIFMLFEPSPGSKPSNLPPATPGGVGWHELTAIDWEKSWPFYAAMFGWEKGYAMPMGEFGTYQIFDVNGESIGAMMTRIDKSQKPDWLYYFDVADTAATAELVKQHGGQVTRAPEPVPTGQIIAHCLDPQGGAFGLVCPAPK